MIKLHFIATWWSKAMLKNSPRRLNVVWAMGRCSSRFLFLVFFVFLLREHINLFILIGGAILYNIVFEFCLTVIVTHRYMFPSLSPPPCPPHAVKRSFRKPEPGSLSASVGRNKEDSSIYAKTPTVVHNKLWEALKENSRPPELAKTYMQVRSNCGRNSRLVQTEEIRKAVAVTLLY